MISRTLAFLTERLREMIEPELFLRAHPPAPGRFADAIVRALGRGL